MQKVFFPVLTFLVILTITNIWGGCANIVPPTGGPRDSLPPRLITVTPKDSSVNFTGNRIIFYFNEYVNLENARENTIVSPTPKIDPIIDFKLRTVTVRIKDTLEPNTTYSINFGNAIRDINEGNMLKEFTYVFSTGAALDNNQLTGKLIVAETGRADSTLTVMLHRNPNDSAVVKERPRYYTKLDNQGNFVFRFLPEGTFYLYALKDEGGSRRYLSKAQLFAFADKPVVVNADSEPVTLFAFIEGEEEVRKPAPAPPSARERNNQDRRLNFQTNLEGNMQDLLSSFEMEFATPLKNLDTSKLVFTAYDFQRLDNYSLSTDSLNKKASLQYAWKPDSTYHVILDKEFAEDSTGRKLLKTDTIDFKVKKETDYGSLRLRFPNVDLSTNPVLLLVQNDKVVFSFPLTTKEFYRKLFKPGDYEVRILFDENRNGKWDTGSFFTRHLQPEKIRAIDQKFQVKSNWDKEDTITL